MTWIYGLMNSISDGCARLSESLYDALPIDDDGFALDLDTATENDCDWDDRYLALVPWWM